MTNEIAKKFKKYLAISDKNSLSLFFVWLLGPFFFYTDSIKYLLLYKIGIPILFVKPLKVMFISSKFLLIIFFILGIHIYIANRKQLLNQNKSLLFIFISAVVMLLGNSGLILLENYTYFNFIYSKIGITPFSLEILNYFLLLSCSFTAVLYLSFYRVKSGLNFRIISIQTVKISVFIALILFILSKSAYPLFNIHKIIRASHMTSEEKFGLQYKYVEVLADSTPKDSVILHPTQGAQWPLIGNQPVIRYFLFPRTLISAGIPDLNSKLAEFDSIYLPIIVDSETAWPLINKETKTVTVEQNVEVMYKDISIIKTNKNDLSILKIELL